MLQLRTEFTKEDFKIAMAASLEGGRYRLDTVQWNLKENRFVVTDGHYLVMIEFPIRWDTDKTLLMLAPDVHAMYTSMKKMDVVVKASIGDDAVEFHIQNPRSADRVYSVALVDTSPIKYHDLIADHGIDKARSWNNFNPHYLSLVTSIFPENTHMQMHIRMDSRPAVMHSYDPETKRAYNALLAPAVVREGHCTTQHDGVATVPMGDWDENKIPEDDGESPFQCVACEDTGKNSKGGPCVPCQNRKKQYTTTPPHPITEDVEGIGYESEPPEDKTITLPPANTGKPIELITDDELDDL